MNKIFGVSALSYRQIVVLIIAVLVSFLLAELIRWHMDKKKRDKNIVKIVRS